MSKITKTAVVSVVGRPNVGKSTLTNKLVGQKVAIVSSKPQTTRTRITGVLSRGETQYVLLDTPGLHKPRSRLGDYMWYAVEPVPRPTTMPSFTYSAALSPASFFISIVFVLP